MTKIHQVVERCGKVAIVQRGEKFWLSYIEDGQTIRRPVGCSLDDAQSAAAQVNAQLHQHAPTLLGFKPIAPREFLQQWLDYHEFVAHSSVATIDRYRAAAGHFIDYLAGRAVKSLDRITVDVARGYAKHLRTKQIAPNGHPHTKRRLMKDKTVIFCMEVARTLLNRAAKDRHLPPYWQNPFADMRLDHIRVMDAKPVIPLSAEEESAFWHACCPWAARLFAVIAYSGMRPGEAASLMIDDVDFNAGTLLIRGKTEFLIATKTRNVRAVPMTPEMRTALMQAIGTRTAGPVFLTPSQTAPEITGQHPDELAKRFAAFMNREQQRLASSGIAWSRAQQHRAAKRGWKRLGGLRAQGIRRAYIRTMRKAGLSGRTCVKDFRHSWATTLQAAGADPFARRDMLGHTGLEQTGQYTHTSVTTLKNEAERARATRSVAVAELQAALA
ncbi:MAG TPA: tyrosine-type recombinase/integrase [Planctomycetota bacterium]